MAIQPGGTPDRAPVLLGVDLLRAAAALLRYHWLPLTLIALASLTLQRFVMDLSVVAGRLGPVPGFMVLSLVPLVPMLGIVSMLLLLRRRTRGSTPLGDLLAAIASVLVPFLVVYQSTGRLDDDRLTYSSEGVWDDNMREVDGSANPGRLPFAESGLVLGIVLAAILLRLVGSRIVRTDRYWRARSDPRRVILRIFVGYSEVVWLVLGAIVVTYGVQEFRYWWSTRVAAQWLSDIGGWISGFWPQFEFYAPGLWDAVVRLGQGAIAGLVVPMSWLAIGVIVYGVRAAELVRVDDLLRLRRVNPVFDRLVTRVGIAPIVRAWKLLTNPDSRFGALIGAAAMILKVGWVPVLTFCLTYVAISQFPYLTWAIIGQVVPPLDLGGWRSLIEPINTVNQSIVLVLSTVVLAASADALLTRFGAASWLRLPGPRPEALDQLPQPDPAELIAPAPAEVGTAAEVGTQAGVTTHDGVTTEVGSSADVDAAPEVSTDYESSNQPESTTQDSETTGHP